MTEAQVLGTYTLRGQEEKKELGKSCKKCGHSFFCRPEIERGLAGKEDTDILLVEEPLERCH
jgi:hypothetical protein